MNDRKLFRLMELIPEEYKEETADFLAARKADDRTAEPPAVIRRTAPEPQSSLLWRILLPAGAAACFAVLIFAGIRTGLREKPVTEASSVPELTEVAVQTGTTSAETARTDAAVLHTETVTQAAVLPNGTAPVQRGTAAVTAAESRQSADGEQTAAQTAAAQGKAPSTTTAAPATQRDPDYLPGDVNMDGKVDICDAQLLWREYDAVVVNGGESTLTPQQIAIGDVYPNTRYDDLDAFRFRLQIGTENPKEVFRTDYPISYEDYTLIMDYYTNMDVNRKRGNLGDLNVEEYAAYLGLPPEDPEIRYIKDTVIMQGDSIPADSVTVGSIGSFPVSTENWEMIYASVESCGDFRFIYNGRENCKGRSFTFTGSISQGPEKTEQTIKNLENETEKRNIEKRTVGHTTVYLLRNQYYDAKWNTATERWDVSELEWQSGDYLMRVITHPQETLEMPDQYPHGIPDLYPEEILEQIIAEFVTDLNN